MSNIQPLDIFPGSGCSPQPRGTGTGEQRRPPPPPPPPPANELWLASTVCRSSCPSFFSCIAALCILLFLLQHPSRPHVCFSPSNSQSFSSHHSFSSNPATAQPQRTPLLIATTWQGTANDQRIRNRGQRRIIIGILLGSDSSILINNGSIAVLVAISEYLVESTHAHPQPP